MAMSPSRAAALDDLMQSLRVRVNRALETFLPEADIQPTRLHAAMRYAVLDGGKRVRAILVYTAAQALGHDDDGLDFPACAVELIHAYSLVHDDLPVMDDDELRRGKPSCHRAFDEATALLAGDALQSLAFQILTNAPEASAREMVRILSVASGSRGMAGGQAIDLAAVGKTLNLPELENMHIHKTGALIRASVRLGALSAPEVESDVVRRLDHYGKCIGLAFQIRDDILDVEGDSEVLGKRRGADQARLKPTYPALMGLSAAKQMAEELHEEALETLLPLGEAANPLRWLSEFVVTRAS